LTDEATVSFLRERVGEIADDFKGEIGRVPTVDELLEILSYGISALPATTFEDGEALASVTFGAKRRGAKQEEEPDAVGDLNDHLFVLAADLFGSLAGNLGTGKLNDKQLSDWLTTVVRALIAGGTVGAGQGDLQKIEVKTARGKSKRGKVGDIVAIPAGGGKYYVAVIVAKNQFGTAYGLFRGRHPLRVPPKDSVVEHPVYSDEDPILAGQWKIIGHNERLRSLFPADPEIFHRPQKTYPGEPEIGPFGSGETVSGKMRNVSQEEAQRLGLLDGSYRQIYPSQIFEPALEKLTAE
jgi:hypothetical protein